jgi:hypothetical protein
MRADPASDSGVKKEIQQPEQRHNSIWEIPWNSGRMSILKNSCQSAITGSISIN